jgi:polyphosphate glucokinase
MKKKRPRPARAKAIRTLVVDIGGSGIKALILDAAGRPITVRSRVKTPSSAAPAEMLRAIGRLAKRQGRFDRVSVGFPGVVRYGIVESAPNLNRKWSGFRLAEKLEQRLGKPVRILNDADMHGFGAISGRGVELVVTLGTGFGSALFVDGKLVPNLEVALYPLNGRTFQEMLGNGARKKAGNRKWNKRLEQAVTALHDLFHYDYLYLGGGNSEKIRLNLPPGVRIVPNIAGLLGGIALWE